MRMYHSEGFSQAALARHYGVAQAAMSKVLGRMGIKAKSKGRMGAENGRYKDGTQSTAYRSMVQKERCNRCGETRWLVIHHKDGVHTNNVPDNLEVLCSPCHSSHHKQEWWNSRKDGQS